MSKAALFRNMALVVLAVTAAFLLISCGDDSSDSIIPVTGAMSQAEATAFATQLFSGAQSGPAFKPQQQQKVLEAPINTFTYTCTSGGNMSISGSTSGTLDNNGTGQLSITMTETITDWKCISNYTVNGSVTVSGTFNFTNALLSSMTMSMTGEVSTQSAGCSINVAVTSSNGTSFAMNGAVCGQTISTSF